MFYQRNLPNGIRVVGEHIPHFDSVSVAFWVKAGAVTEESGESGISHFLEHMMFKGTNKRTSREISTTMDGVGGQLNAYTAKECTCFYARVMREHLPLAFDVLSDMLSGSLLDNNEIEKEKGVVLEEIRMVNDTPDDVAHELINDLFFDGHPISLPILGTSKSVKALSQEKMQRYINKWYGGENLVISLAGNFDTILLDELCDQFLVKWSPSQRHVDIPKYQPNLTPRIVTKRKSVEQVHICIGYPGLTLSDENVYALLTLNNILGGGMSSRLFQLIREDKGLAYSVYSYPSFYRDGGMFSVYAGTNPSQAAEVCRLLLSEIDQVANGQITQDEFMRAVEQMKGSWALSQESTSSRASSLGKSILLLNRIMDSQEIIQKMNAVTLETVKSLATNLLKAPPCAALVGRVDEKSPAVKALGF